jgi:hypothetical protein
MISIDVMGGLGNQLFMIFATLAYGIQNNTKVVFSTRVFGERDSYWNTFFNDLVDFTTEHPGNKVDTNHFVRYNEPSFMYQPLPHFGEQNVCLHGYYQSYKYFESVTSIIFQLFHLSVKKEIIREKYRDIFGDKETASMHFRLGDYKTKRTHHPIMNYEYFEKSLDYIMKHKPAVSRVVYLCEREDNEYVGNQIRQLRDKYPQLEFVKIDDTIKDYEQLLIMSCCHHNIMSNSTFSWWGAYFNEYVDKVVCYPSVWFGESYSHYSHKDMMLPGWVQIEASPKPSHLPL